MVVALVVIEVEMEGTVVKPANHALAVVELVAHLDRQVVEERESPILV